MEALINTIKSDFRSEIAKNDPKIKRKAMLGGELYNLTMQTDLFEEAAKEKKIRLARVEKVSADLNKLETEIEEIKANQIYENAFEWRFEFPEILNDQGDFVGFDLVIGNPPYIRQEEFSSLKPYLKDHFKTFSGTADLYVYFVELSMSLLKNSGNFVFIIPNKWMRAGYGKALRSYIKTFDLHELLDFGDLQVFEEATTYPLIIGLSKSTPSEKFTAVNLDTLDFPLGMNNYLAENRIEVLSEGLSDEGWTLTDSKVQKLLLKLKSQGKPLSEYVDGKIYRGVLTGLNEAFVIDQKTKDKLMAEDPRSAEVIKPFLAGRDIKRYQQPKSDKYLILFPKGFTIKSSLSDDDPNYINSVSKTPRYGNREVDPAWNYLKSNYPAIANHLKPYEEAAKKRTDQGDFWWELRACDYYEEFEKEKIIYPNICKRPEFTLDDRSKFTNQKCFIITQFDKSLIGVLNSNLSMFLFKSILPKLRGDFYEPSYMYFKDFPILKDESGAIDKFVDQILELKKIDGNADTSKLENQIDQFVYEMYGLSEEEIGIVEGDKL
jgi:hypothetical protein